MIAVCNDNTRIEREKKKKKRKRKLNMSRAQQESQGVVLTGYHSNAELLPKNGVSSASDPDPMHSRYCTVRDRPPNVALTVNGGADACLSYSTM